VQKIQEFLPQFAMRWDRTTQVCCFIPKYAGYPEASIIVNAKNNHDYILRLYELRNEVVEFLSAIQSQKEPKLKAAQIVQLFKESDFLIKLAYLCDILTSLNQLNSSMQGPFIYDAYNLPEELTTPAQEELLSLASDISLKQRFNLSTLEKFCLTTERTYTHLYSIAMKMLLKFPTLYLCEKGFLTMLFLKNKYRARLDVEHDMRIKLANDEPDIQIIEFQYKD
jgi:hypothetical protein